jgi:hypothetical protein
MRFELENGRPRDGDLVRVIGDPNGPVMKVLAFELGEDHIFEGVRNGIYCTWSENGVSQFEVFRPGTLEILHRLGVREGPLEVTQVITDNGYPKNDPRYRVNYQTEFKGSSVYLDSSDPIFVDIDDFLKRMKIVPNKNGRYFSIKRTIAEQFLDNEIDQYKIVLANTDLMQLRAITYTSTGLTEMPPSFIRAINEDSFIPLDPKKATHGRNFLFEHFIAAKLRGAGCMVTAEEPDWQCEYYPLRFNVAVKRSGVKRLEANIKSARDQILARKEIGLIALDVTKDNLSQDKEFRGSRTEYIKQLHAWLDDNVMDVIRRNLESWKIDGSKIPAILVFHFGVCFDPALDTWYSVPHFTLFDVGFPQPMNFEEILMRPHLERLFKSIHGSHPENGIILNRTSYRYIFDYLTDWTIRIHDPAINKTLKRLLIAKQP